MKIKLSQIKPSPRPIRSSWDEDKMNELAQSIKEQGLIVPIKVRPADNQHYEVVYGHRRVEAMRRAGVAETDALVEGVDDTDALIQALIENIQREDMEPIDIAKAIDALQNETGWSQHEMERRGIMEQTRVSLYLSLLAMPEKVQRLVSRGTLRSRPDETITEGHVRAIRRTSNDDNVITSIAEKASKEKLSVPQTEKVAKSVAATKDPRRREMLLETPYSSFIHDPEINRARAERYGEYDPMTVKREPTQGQQWEATPEVKAIIDALKLWQERVPEMCRAVEQGKLAPEAKPFILQRVESLISALRELAIELEE